MLSFQASHHPEHAGPTHVITEELVMIKETFTNAHVRMATLTLIVREVGNSLSRNNSLYQIRVIRNRSIATSFRWHEIQGH